MRESDRQWQWICDSVRFLAGAKTLWETDRDNRGDFLVKPTLHLTGQGIELFLKAMLVEAGATDQQLKKFGHNLWLLWNDRRLEPIRVEVRKVSADWITSVALERKGRGLSTDTGAMHIHPNLQLLSVLHDRMSNFALRYPSETNQYGPRSEVLFRPFFQVADRHAKMQASSLL